MWRRWTSSATIACTMAAAAGCGGAPPAETAETPAPAAQPAEPEPEGDEVPLGEDGLPLPAEDEAGSDATAADEADDGDAEASGGGDDSKRERVYRWRPGMPVILEVDGAKLTFTAKAVKAGAGWGVQVAMLAQSDDGEPHRLASPKSGPMAFGGKAGDATIADERSGDGEELLGDAEVKFTREYPGKNSDWKPMKRGEPLDLWVGVWGLDRPDGSMKILRRAVRVQLTWPSGAKAPKLVLSPPQ